ncbi:putative ribosomal-protein-alanine acetyltransferase [Glycine soja]
MCECIISRPKLKASSQATYSILMEGAAICSTADAREEGVDLTQISLRPIHCTWEPYTSKEGGINFIHNIASKAPWFRAICINNRIATHAVKQVVKAAFSEFPHLERLQALVDVENVASQRVLEKAGFQREGVLRKYVVIKGKSRDMITFSVLPNDPLS